MVCYQSNAESRGCCHQYPVGSSRRSSSSDSPAQRREATDIDRLELADFSALYSALRYDCQIEALALRGAMDGIYRKGEREQCWRWLVFGIFYPRSRRLAARNKFRASHDGRCHRFQEAPRKSSVGTAGCRTKSCSNSSRQAKLKDTPGQADCGLLLCMVKQGAVFYRATDIAFDMVEFRLNGDRELEALTYQDGWTWLSFLPLDSSGY